MGRAIVDRLGGFIQLILWYYDRKLQDHFKRSRDIASYIRLSILPGALLPALAGDTIISEYIGIRVRRSHGNSGEVGVFPRRDELAC